MAELVNPPVLGEGFVQGRFVGVSMGNPAGPDRLPDLRGLRGTVYFKPIKKYDHVTTGTPATVFPDPLYMEVNTDGWLVDRASQADANLPPGGWLPVGRYEVHAQVAGNKRVAPFSIEVTTAHTVAEPLNLNTAAPIILPPKAVEVVRVIDRELAQAAAAEAAASAELAALYSGENGSGPVAWDQVLEKPTEFTPTAHTHSVEQVDGLQASLAGMWKKWTGTQAQYDALGTYDPDTLYVVI